MFPPEPRASKISFGIENCNGAVFRRKLGWAFKLRFPFFVRSCKLAPNDDVKICRNLRAWVIEDQKQKPIVVFSHWSCHAVASYDKFTIDASHPGIIRSAIRDFFGSDVPVIMMPGCSGDIRPDFRRSFPTTKRILSLSFSPIFSRPSAKQVG